MANNKSIDGLSPRRPKKTTVAASANGFSPFVQPRKTAYSSRIHTNSTQQGTIHPENFIPPRKTTSKSARQTTRTLSADPYPLIPGSKPKTRQSTPKTKKSAPKPADLESVNEEFLEPSKTFDFDEETGELVKAKDPQPIEPKKNAQKSSKSRKKPGKKKWSKKRKIWTWIGIIFLLLLVGGGIWLVLWGNDLLARLTGGRGNLFDLISEHYEPLKEDENGRTNILAFGTSGFNMEGVDYGGETHDGAELTDSIMLISFDQDTGNATMISLPRDLKVDAGCNYTGKINEVYYCNNLNDDNEEGGAEALMKEVGDIFDLDIPYFVHVNWGSLESVVNALDGITVTLDEPVADYGYTNAVYQADTPYRLNGEQAIGLSRARHGTENGDFSRGAFQQKILLGIKDRVLEEGLSVSQLIDLSGTLGDNLRTNFSVGELKSLAHLATTVDWNNITTANFLTPEPLLTAGEIGGISYVYPTAGVTDFSAIRSYVQSLLSSNPVTREDASILILDTTPVVGIADTEQTALEEIGFTKIYIDDFAPASDVPYTLYSFTDQKPNSTSALEEKYGITALTDYPDGLPLGYDFILILGEQ